MLSQRRGDDRLRVGLRARQLGRDPALAHDEHAVAEVRDLLGLARVEEERLALAEQLDHQLVDVVLGADVDAARDVVEQQDVAARRAASGRSAPSAGCRRRACPPPARDGRRRADLEALDDPRAERRLGRAAASTPAARRAARIASVRLSRTDIGSSSPSVLRSSGTSAMPMPAPDRVGRLAGSACARPPTAISPPRRLARAEQRHEEVALALPGQTADAQDLAAAQRRTRRRRTPRRRAGRGPRAPTGASSGTGGRSGYMRSIVRPVISVTASRLVDRGCAWSTCSPLRKTVIRSARSTTSPQRCDVKMTHAPSLAQARARSRTATRPRARRAPRLARRGRGCPARRSSARTISITWRWASESAATSSSGSIRSTPKLGENLGGPPGRARAAGSGGSGPRGSLPISRFSATVIHGTASAPGRRSQRRAPARRAG